MSNAYPPRLTVDTVSALYAFQDPMMVLICNFVRVTPVPPPSIFATHTLYRYIYKLIARYATMRSGISRVRPFTRRPSSPRRTSSALVRLEYIYDIVVQGVPALDSFDDKLNRLKKNYIQYF